METLNLLFEAPLFLLLIPALFFLMFIGRKKRKLTASSEAVFNLADGTRIKRLTENVVFRLPKVLIYSAICLLAISAAEPRSTQTKVVKRVETGRVAVIIDDISASMGGESMEILKSANLAFLDAFCKTADAYGGLSENLVAVVSFSNDADIRMTPTRDCALIRRRVQSLEIESSTAIEKGLWKGLALLIEWVDRGIVIPRDEYQSIKASLYERQVRLPKNSAEFCRRYKGLSILLFTDGDFDQWFMSREKALQMTQDKFGLNSINPFNVIDLAKSLCIRTYFWSMGNLPESYKEAFSEPKGTGFAMEVYGISQAGLLKSYEEVAKKESGEIISEEIVSFNPLKRYFILAGAVCFLLGILILWSKNYSHHPDGD